LARLLEGRPIAEQIKTGLKGRIQSSGKHLKLASVQAGRSPAAEVYVKSLKKVAEGLGIEFALHALDAAASQQELVDLIKGLNADSSVNGIIVQMPLPQNIDHKAISSHLAWEKDVEGMHPANLGRLVCDQARIAPCTAQAAMELLAATGVDCAGKEAVVVGHSEIVGKPVCLMLLDKLATVTVCHIGTSRAGKLEEHVRKAEILIVAAGKAGLIKGEWIKEGAIVIDAGINRVGDKIVGDVEFEAAEKRAGWITPVPGGVGPLTVTMLMRNLVLTSL
jgi:methylenetetrahydrofolate dehydrogenase (NADP+)/methenyltetrahydrofolate cyclohydrolase